jgi:hypothetical protein
MCIIHFIRNPINAIRHKFAADIAREEKEREEREREEKESRKRAEKESLALAKAKAGRFKRPLDVAALTPAHTEYWAEGVGEGGDKPWKFMCSCGEKCSSYEHFRYHPVGRMFECSSCSIWSHVLCVLGNICDDDLEELQVPCHAMPCHTTLLCFNAIYASAHSSERNVITSDPLSSSQSQEVLCSTCRGKFRRQRLHELGEAGITLGPNGIPCIDTVSSSMCESTSHSDEECVGDDSHEEVIGDVAAEDSSDGCPAVSESYEVDMQHFTDASSQPESIDAQHCAEISETALPISSENVPIGTWAFSVPENVPYSSASTTAVIYSSSFGVHLSLSDQLSQLQSHSPSANTAGILHYNSSLSDTLQGEQVPIAAPAPPTVDAGASIDAKSDGASYHRIDSFEEIRDSLLAYKCIVNAIPIKIDKCSVVSLTDCDDSSSHSSNIDDDIMSAGCPDVQSADAICKGQAALYAAKITIEEFGSPPLSPCIEPL